MKHFFSTNSSGDLRSDARQSQFIGGDADEDHIQIIGGDTIPPGFRHPCSQLFIVFTVAAETMSNSVRKFSKLHKFMNFSWESFRWLRQFKNGQLKTKEHATRASVVPIASNLPHPRRE